MNATCALPATASAPSIASSRTPDGEPGLNYLCAGYKLFFKHVDPYMKFMANELRHQRPPANVMSWIRQQEHSAALATGIVILTPVSQKSSVISLQSSVILPAWEWFLLKTDN